MLYYICKDLINSLRYLPFGILAGLVCFCTLNGWNKSRIRRQKDAFPVMTWTLFVTYLAIVLMITFLSRESGSRIGMDLELFSTWGINKRNNAYVVENVLLFIPYGFLCSLTLRFAEKFRYCLMLGAFTSLGIELLQLATGRGYFQIDDILTNILGTVIGYLVYFLYAKCAKIITRKKGTKEA